MNVNEFKITPSQRKVLKKFNRYLERGRPSSDDNKMEDIDEEKKENGNDNAVGENKKPKHTKNNQNNSEPPSQQKIIKLVEIVNQVYKHIPDFEYKFYEKKDDDLL